MMSEYESTIFSKRQAIKCLSKVKLVIGNGFDLQCGMHSRYKDYFDSVSKINNSIENWANAFNHDVYGYLYSSDYYWQKLENEDIINAWDCFFWFKVKDEVEAKKWVDIETEMGKSFHGVGNLQGFWHSVYYAGQSRRRDYEKNIYLLAAIIKHKQNGDWFSSDEEFYYFILEELKLFEKRFGKFIYEQQNATYRKNYESLVSRLTDIKQLASIDSFNYSVLEKPGIHQININGNYVQPIFGIDSQDEQTNNPIYIFTKTYRRIENDTEKTKIELDPDFENVVVYGHSLCKHDYSYFFPLMDKLKLYDFTANGQMIFAYSVYDKRRESEIKTAHRFAVAKLIEAYAKYKGIAQPNRLLDFLSIFRRIWMYELTAE